MTDRNAAFPRITPVGLNGMLISFSDRLSEGANRAALAFRAAIEGRALPGVIETTTSLTSAYVVFDPLTLPVQSLRGALLDLLAETDWSRAPLPSDRQLWRLPAAFGGAHGPQLEEAAAMAGVDPDTAIAEICAARTRVLTIGFSPGQPYLGSLPENWDIPRQTGITKSVPCGAVTVAIRQIVLFATTAPTGWRMVGETAFQGFRPESTTPIALRPGDEVQFFEITAKELAEIRARDTSGDGGACVEAIS